MPDSLTKKSHLYSLQTTSENKNSRSFELDTRKPPRFNTAAQKDFVRVLNQRTAKYFKDNDISRQANLAMVFKSVFHLSIWIGSYLLLVFGGFDLAISYLLWAILGFSMAMVCVNIGHDAIHGAYSKHTWVNSLLSHTFNINGASAYMWKRMHNQAHHTYTNIDGHDEDIAPAPIVRLCSQAPLWSIHKYQHIYSFFLYALSTLSWVFVKDYKKFFTNKVGNYTHQKHPKKEYFLLFFYKIINYTVFIFIPLLVLPFSWQSILAGFLLMHLVSGFSLAIIFMLAHVIEETHFLLPDEKGNLEHSWTVHQLYTTANFAQESKLMAFLTGGLNQQVEHHLFPNVCSIHYPALAKIVRKTAEEYGYPYITDSFSNTIRSHARFLKKMGRPSVTS